MRGTQANSKVTFGLIGTGNRGSYDASIVNADPPYGVDTRFETIELLEPEKPVVRAFKPGMPIALSASVIAATASLSAASGARLKLIVADGNCSWWAITSGAVVYWKRAKAPSGICGFPVVEMTGGVTTLVVSEVLAGGAALPEPGT